MTRGDNDVFSLKRWAVAPVLISRRRTAWTTSPWPFLWRPRRAACRSSSVCNTSRTSNSTDASSPTTIQSLPPPSTLPERRFPKKFSSPDDPDASDRAVRLSNHLKRHNFKADHKHELRSHSLEGVRKVFKFIRRHRKIPLVTSLDWFLGCYSFVFASEGALDQPPPKARMRLTVDTACEPANCTAARCACSTVRSASMTSRKFTAPSWYWVRDN